MDYKKLGLKCGIEIHQQLEGQKLFCHCPTLLREETPDFRIRRKIRASAGEEGKVDIAARQEQLRDKTFVYEGYSDTTCLVETDEEPPHNLNPEALSTALQLSTFLNSEISSVIQVMRKTIVDGSNTSGFQRTALIARNGRIQTTDGEVNITNISLEEDSSKIVSESLTERIYRLDRLGIPLIEIGTAPDIKTPEQGIETAKKLGLLLRSLPGIKRGLGTIRQDVNVSVADGERIEIKGAQDLRMLPTIIGLEAQRQVELLKIKQELRGLRLSPFEIVDLSTILADCTSKIVQSTLEKKGKILGLMLNGFSGFIGKELQPGYRLGTEFSGRAKIIAGVGGIFHSDELPNYGIEQSDIVKIRKKLKCGSTDAFILICDEEQKARLALKAVHTRASEVLLGIPREVRKANADGTTSYLRPISGEARMYPETDVPLIRPSLDTINLPELLEDKIKRFQTDLNLSVDLATFIARSDHLLLFEELVKKYPLIKPAFIAETLGPSLLEIKRVYSLDPEKLTEHHFRDLFQYLAEEKIHKDIVLDILIDMITGKFDLAKYETLSTEALEETIRNILGENPTAPLGALMGMCMKKLGGKASGKVISEILQRLKK